MGYLKCDKCGGYYELKPGESLSDFEKCQCGGKLQYVENKDYKIEDPVKTENKEDSLKIKVLGLGVGSIVMLVPYMLFPGSLYVFMNWISLAVWVIAGLIAVYVLNGNLRKGIKNGFVIAALSGIVAIFTLVLTVPAKTTGLSFNLAYDFGFFLGDAILYIFTPAIFSIIGGILAVAIHTKTNKTQPKHVETPKGE